MTALADIDRAELVTHLFIRLRQRGLELGIDEYKAGLALVQDPSAQALIPSAEALRLALRMVWCSSFSEQEQFEPIWQSAWAAVTAPSGTDSSTSIDPDVQKSTQPTLAQPPRPTPPISPKPEPLANTPSAEQIVISPAIAPAIQPVQSPFTPAEIEHPPGLHRYWPVSRRSMSYRWRMLQRPVTAGPADQLDIAATVNQVAQQGFFLAPVMEQRTANQARLLLLVDQKGSMMPMHPITRQVVETAQFESTLPRDQVQVGYFHNVPAEQVYQDPYLTCPLSLSALLAQCDDDTSVIIVSDAGAARGYRQMTRIRDTTRFLRQIRRATTRFAWLNPVPQERWDDCSAGIIANLVPMFAMDEQGLDGAIAVVRGLQPGR